MGTVMCDLPLQNENQHLIHPLRNGSDAYGFPPEIDACVVGFTSPVPLVGFRTPLI